MVVVVARTADCRAECQCGVVVVVLFNILLIEVMNCRCNDPVVNHALNMPCTPIITRLFWC